MGLSLRWGIATLLLGFTVAMAQAGDQATLRDDVFLLMGASLRPVGTAAYCNKYIEPNDGLIDAVAAWNKRNDAAMRRTIAVLEWTGGMSSADKATLNRYATKLIKESVDSEPDRAAYCRHLADQMDSGAMDLDRGEETAPALLRIMAADIK